MKKDKISDINNPMAVVYLEEVLRKTEQELLTFLVEAEIMAIAEFKLSGAGQF